MKQRYRPIFAGEEPRPDKMRWEQFQEHFLDEHEQGQHIAIVGPTGKGKTTTGLEFCKLVGSRMGEDRRPSRVTVLGSKPKDDTLAKLIQEGGWPEIRKWPPGFGEEHCVVWPRGGSPEEEAIRQKRVFAPLIDTIYKEGGQSLFTDEEAYFEMKPPDGLGMTGKMNKIWIGGRSNAVTLIGATQRPRSVTRSMWSEPAWVIVYPPDDEDDLKRVAEMSGSKYEVMAACDRLGPWEFLCINRKRDGTKRTIVSRVEL